MQCFVQVGRGLQQVVMSCSHVLLVMQALKEVVMSCSHVLLVMQALKEVYLPESGMWIAKYPFVDRDVFLDISLDIERERKSQQQAL